MLSHFSRVLLCVTLQTVRSGSSVHGILQTGILGWVSVPPSRSLPDLGIEPTSLTLAGGFFTTSDTWEAHYIPFAVLCCAVLLLSCSVMSDSTTLRTAARQAPLSMRILQARILEWVAMSSSRGSSPPRD